MDNQHHHSAIARVPLSAAAPAAPILLSRELFRESNTVHIEHEGQRYLLRLTRGNKLILTK